MDQEERERIESARETFQVLMEMANMLDTDLDAQSLTYCIRLCENGISPDALVQALLQIQNEVDSYNSKNSSA